MEELLVAPLPWRYLTGIAVAFVAGAIAGFWAALAFVGRWDAGRGR